MRLIVASLAAIVAFGLCLLPAHAMGVKNMIQNEVDNAAEQHNQDVENALGNGQNKIAPPAAPGELKSGWITRKSKDGKEVRLYFSYPAALTKAKPASALIVLQEEFGVNDEVQNRVRTFAAKGYYAVAPDLYYGKVPADAAEAAKLKAAMSDSLAMTAMKTSLDLLDEEVKNGVVNSQRVGVVGWSIGGQQAMLLAVAEPRIHAAALFYGMPVTDVTALKKFSGPVFAVFANDDTAPASADVEKFKSAMKTARGDLTVYTFEGVGHGFVTKSNSTGTYNEQKASEALNNLNAWLDKKLPAK